MGNGTSKRRSPINHAINDAGELAKPADEVAAQGELTDGAGRTVGEVLKSEGSGKRVEVAARTVLHSERTPATAEDPLRVCVPEDFTGEEGRRVANGWYCGHQLGAGAQGAVFAVVDEQGADLGRVFKQLNLQALGEVSGLVTGMEREWVIGQQLNALAEKDGFLAGFMQTGSAVVDNDGRFRGMMLEKLNGKDATSRFEDPLFADIEYVGELLRQTLTALNKAELALGFKHRDMRLENIMEHRTDAAGGKQQHAGHEAGSNGSVRVAPAPSGFGPRVPLQGLHFKVIDYGHAVIERSDAKFGSDAKHRTHGLHRLLPRVPTWALPEQVYRWVFRDRGDVWRLARSCCTAMEGRTWPVADKPRVEKLRSFIHTTTGMRPRTYYAHAPATIPRSKGWLHQALATGGRLFFVRWIRTMAQAYLFPGRPSMTPMQALHVLGHEA